MRVANPGFDAANVLTAPIVSDLQGFSLPIFSLGGMKETTRLRNPTLLDCQNGGYQYALLAPYIYEYNYEVNAYNGSTQVCRA